MGESDGNVAPLELEDLGVVSITTRRRLGFHLKEVFSPHYSKEVIGDVDGYISKRFPNEPYSMDRVRQLTEDCRRGDFANDYVKRIVRREQSRYVLREVSFPKVPVFSWGTPDRGCFTLDGDVEIVVEETEHIGRKTLVVG